MTRKSRREIEQMIEEWDDDHEGSTSDLEQGVIAEWVTYDWSSSESEAEDLRAEFVTPDEDGGVL